MKWKETGSKPSVTIAGQTKHSCGLHSPIDTERCAYAYKPALKSDRQLIVLQVE